MMECSSFNVHHYDKHQQLYQYVQLLFNRFISHHFKTGAIEVHLIFDSPSVQAFNPKYHERTRRDTAHTPTSSHEHITFTPSTVIPNSWRPLIECRECKQSIMAALSLAYAQTISLKLQAHQKLIVGGNLRDVWEISGGATSSFQTREMYNTNAEEADMRIWRHMHQSKANRFLIYSPDTDVLHYRTRVASNCTLGVDSANKSSPFP